MRFLMPNISPITKNLPALKQYYRLSQPSASVNFAGNAKGSYQPNMHTNAGFTLIELIAVIVVLSITAVVGAGFITSVIDQYQKAEIRSSLVLKGAVAMEQLTRQIRMATPNSIRVSSSGNCVEFLPLIGTAFYFGQVPDIDNDRPLTNTIDTMPFSLGGVEPKFVLVAPLSPDETYSAVDPSPREIAGNFGSEPFSRVVLNNPHEFLRNSLNNRILISDDPKRFCVRGGDLVSHDDYGFLTSSITDAAPAGTQVLISSDVTAGDPAFAVSLGSEDRNALLDIQLIFSDSGEQITLNNRVLIRNVP